MNKIIIKYPKTENEWEEYYELRYQILRAAWGKERGTEKDELESESLHLIAVDGDNVVGVIRLNQIDKHTAQVRFMAVKELFQGKGIGSKLLIALEKIAITIGVKKIVLNARENAVTFYSKNGYVITKTSYKLWDIIQHYYMEKEL